MSLVFAPHSVGSQRSGKINTGDSVRKSLKIKKNVKIIITFKKLSDLNFSKKIKST